MPRIHCSVPLGRGQVLTLPEGAARHVQVLRMQPGEALTLFDGTGGEWTATIERMGRTDVVVRLLAHSDIEREAPRPVHIGVGLAANERMDWLVEKATELGAASIQPLATARSVLKLSGERAERKRAHWQAIAIAACEQCGRNRVPDVHPIVATQAWIASLVEPGARWVLSFDDRAVPLPREPATGAVWVLSGPEGGLTAQEEETALAGGFGRVTLGPRVLRAETAPLAVRAPRNPRI
jgi:16S rRNA (uracil1498-N3)-methyltransferase